MKSQAAALVITCLLASCGGGDGGGDSDLIQNDDGTPVIPVTPVDDSGAQLGALSELVGRVAIAYSFTGTDPIFSLVLDYTADDFIPSDDGMPILFGTAVTFIRESQSSALVQTRDLTLACGHLNTTDQFLCITDVGGESEGYFAFDSLVNGSAQGSFEFCNGVGSATCSDGVQFSPDGSALLQVSNSLAKSITSSEHATVYVEALPYYQYLKQGAPEPSAAAQALRGEGDALADLAIEIKDLIAGQ